MTQTIQHQPASCDSVLSRIAATEMELRQQMRRVEQCMDRMTRISRMDEERFKGALQHLEGFNPRPGSSS